MSLKLIASALIHLIAKHFISSASKSDCNLSVYEDDVKLLMGGTELKLK